MARKQRISAILCGVALLLSAGLGHAMDIDAKSFRCMDLDRLRNIESSPTCSIRCPANARAARRSGLIKAFNKRSYVPRFAERAGHLVGLCAFPAEHLQQPEPAVERDPETIARSLRDPRRR